ncbi:carbonic anhydrase [Microcoleus sp. FACHB-1515]|uniref:carbonic anhydrase n=1 Tax=Cyanophyceae TaxID=3028117 RepID=UPI00168A2963|nr:carbonic anhydrase [Microcoleus sp. FACHB-1515]MBD2092705.1 carbonic anhydrase [Microcoleus sp. FACHB-1515]
MEPAASQTARIAALTNENLSADDALQKLMAGNQRFIYERSKSPNQTLSRLDEVVREQKPFATILGCSDSRVPIEVIFDQGLGDLFVIRVAGNIVTPTELASIEYGASVLKTRILFVLGHKNCGAVSATLKGGNLLGQMNTLIDSIQPAVDRSLQQPGDRLENAIRENVFWQMERLKESSIVCDLLQQQQIKIIGGYFDLETGKVSIFNVITNHRSTIQVNHIHAF